MSATLYAIGTGPGDPELLTIKAIKTLKNVDVIACPAKDGNAGTAFSTAKEACPEITEKKIIPLEFPMKKEGLKEAHDNAAEQIIKLLQNGNDVAFLTLGDPGFYSTFFYIAERIKSEGFPVEIISGIPSFCAVSAKLQLPIALGDEHVVITSGKFLDFDGTQVILKAGGRLSELKERIKAAGKEAYLVENCGMPDEKVYSGIDSIPDTAGYFSILIVR